MKKRPFYFSLIFSFSLFGSSCSDQGIGQNVDARNTIIVNVDSQKGTATVEESKTGAEKKTEAAENNPATSESSEPLSLPPETETEPSESAPSNSVLNTESREKISEILKQLIDDHINSINAQDTEGAYNTLHDDSDLFERVDLSLSLETQVEKLSFVVNSISQNSASATLELNLTGFNPVFGVRTRSYQTYQVVFKKQAEAWRIYDLELTNEIPF